MSVWYYVNKEGVQEDPALHEGPMQNETGYFIWINRGKVSRVSLKLMALFITMTEKETEVRFVMDGSRMETTGII